MFSLDLGNSYSSLFDGTVCNTIRSVVAHPRSVTNNRKGTGLIQVEGVFYHVGEGAFRYDAYDLMASHDKQVSSNLDDINAFMLRLLSMTTTRFEPKTKILVSVPDLSGSYQHELVKKLNGAKLWEDNNAEHQTIIQVTSVQQEGFGSWYMAKRSSLLPSTGYTLVIDLGGGTVLGVLIDNESGEVIKTRSFKRLGVGNLAQLIQSDTDLQVDNGGDYVRTESIFKGMEDGSYRIGANGADFSQYFDVYRKEWWKRIFQGTIVPEFSQQFQRRDITKVLVTGGGAEIVRPFILKAMSTAGVGKLFAISSNPREDNVRGVYFHAADKVR